MLEFYELKDILLNNGFNNIDSGKLESAMIYLYSKSDKKIIDIEKYLINNNEEFYNNNHDSFFVEIDANMYAVKRMLNEFSNKEALDICKKKVDMLNKVYNDDEFIKLEYEVYNDILRSK